MQWAFTPSSGAAASGALKRASSSPSLVSPLAKRPAVAAAAAAAAQPGGNGAAASVDLQAVAQKHGWDLEQRNDWSNDPKVMWIPLAAIRRPLARSRSNDPEKVEALMQSIQDIGLQEPIDILEVDGQYWGFSGCHRFEAHQRLGKEMILCRVRKANQQVLRFHMM